MLFFAWFYNKAAGGKGSFPIINNTGGIRKRWYVIHTIPVMNKRKSERKVHSLGMENEIFRIVIPMENEVEVKTVKTQRPEKGFPVMCL